MSTSQIFKERQTAHDETENEVMNIIRPFTSRRHLPDRFISLNDILMAWDMKTSIFVEKNSHDEYFRLFEQDGIPVFIVYQVKGEKFANWIHQLEWDGPHPPSPKSTSGDPYYKISGGIPLLEFLQATR